MMLLPTTTTIVDKYPLKNSNGRLATSDQRSDVASVLENIKPSTRTLLQILKEAKVSSSFKKVIEIAGMESLLDDSQANMTIFVPSELYLPKIILESCTQSLFGRLGTFDRKSDDIEYNNFEDARKLVNSVIVPNILTTTMMIQSAYTFYKTRDTINRLFVETPHCVQFEPYTFNKPPFGIILNNKSRIVIPDIIASNGMVHIIDKYPYRVPSDLRSDAANRPLGDEYLTGII